MPRAVSWPGTCPHVAGAHGARQTPVQPTDTGLLTATISPWTATNRLLRGFKVPRSCRVAPCRGGGAGGSSLSSLVPFPCLPAPCEARRQPSRSAPAEQPLCLERGSWPGSQRDSWPILLLPRPAVLGDTGGGCPGGPPSHGCPEPRWAWKAPGAVPGEKATPCLIVVAAIKVGHKGPASWVTLPPAICSGLGLATGHAPAQD